MKNPTPLYEQWLNAANQVEFLNSLDDMAKSCLLDNNPHHYYRINEYPPLEDLADALAKDDASALAIYKQKCLEVKSRYPKPGV